MKFAIITSVPHGVKDNQYFAYSPYVIEMNVWIKTIDSVKIVAPLILNHKTEIETFYFHKKIEFYAINEFNILNLKSVFRSFVKIPKILFVIFKTFWQSDHIHIRCPGNVGLLASVVQIFFPKKKKTAKYAGNWDPKANNPISYKLQKWILSNTFLTKNMQVLVYGEWQNQTKNIKPFFTATYQESDKKEVNLRNFDNKIEFLFVGMLTKGKNPLYAIQIIEKLKIKYNNINLSIYGEGKERESLEKYIKINNLENLVSLKGNQNADALQKAYQESHFMILPSESEGWPKAVAEAMFWGCLPISTKVSCVANMLDNGNRGILIDFNLVNDLKKIELVLANQNDYQDKVTNALNWSRKYTLDYFEQEIKLLLQ